MNKHIEEVIEEFRMRVFTHSLLQNLTTEERFTLSDNLEKFVESSLTSIAEKSDQEGYQRGREDEREESTKCPIPGCRRNHYKD